MASFAKTDAAPSSSSTSALGPDGLGTPEYEEEAETTLVSVLERRESTRRMMLQKDRSRGTGALESIPDEAAQTVFGPGASAGSSSSHSNIQRETSGGVRWEEMPGGSDDIWLQAKAVHGNAGSRANLGGGEKTRPRLVDFALRVKAINKAKAVVMDTTESTDKPSELPSKADQMPSPPQAYPPPPAWGRSTKRRGTVMGPAAGGETSVFGSLTAKRRGGRFSTDAFDPLKQSTQVTSADQLLDIAEYVETTYEQSVSDMNGGGGLTPPQAVQVPSAGDEEMPGETTKLVPDGKSSITSTRRGRSSFFRRRIRHCCVGMWEVFRPVEMLWNILKFLVFSVMGVMIPLLIAAWGLYYHAGDPELQFLPSDASISWWLIFVVRQVVTLHLAMSWEYIYVKGFALRSTVSVRVIGPLLTLSAIQSSGWPFILAAWGVFDLLLMQGDQPFFKNWLFFLNIPMFSETNSDAGILASDLYARILVSMVIIGVAVGLKRTYVSLYMGRRMLEHFKPQLEKIVNYMNLIAEVADLAMITDAPEFKQAMSEAESSVTLPPRALSSIGTRGLKFFEFPNKSVTTTERTISESVIEEDEFLSADQRKEDGASVGEGGDDETEFGSAPRPDKNQWRQFRQSEVSEESEDSKDLTGAPKPETKNVPGTSPLLSPTTSTTSAIRLKSLLDEWDEPENKLEKKNTSPSIFEILQFRRAMTYMEGSYPFSPDFGPAGTRDQCIKSAMKLYKKLLLYTPGATNLGFHVIGVLAYDEQGTFSQAKAEALVRLFRPDRFDEVTQLAFVQSCDLVYKKVRYLSASVTNSSMIDLVLEQMFNVIFYFILGLVVMTVLKFDPWTLLLSLSTLLVSFAFAVGPSTAKYIEGILLIAVRRPFDIGDRITISSPSGAGDRGPGETWLVEDLTLTTTTLRFAATNEVSTVNNYSIAGERIGNGARSPKAIVTLVLPFNIKVTHEQVEVFRSSVATYVKERPRTWAGVICFITTKMEPANGLVEYALKVQHQRPLQELLPILKAKGELLKFCVGVGSKLGISWQWTPRPIDMRLLENQEEQNEDATKSLRDPTSLWQSLVTSSKK